MQETIQSCLKTGSEMSQMRLDFEKTGEKRVDPTAKQQPCDSYITRLQARIFKESEE